MHIWIISSFNANFSIHCENPTYIRTNFSITIVYPWPSRPTRISYYIIFCHIISYYLCHIILHYITWWCCIFFFSFAIAPSVIKLSLLHFQQKQKPCLNTLFSSAAKCRLFVLLFVFLADEKVVTSTKEDERSKYGNEHAPDIWQEEIGVGVEKGRRKGVLPKKWAKYELFESFFEYGISKGTRM